MIYTRILSSKNAIPLQFKRENTVHARQNHSLATFTRALDRSFAVFLQTPGLCGWTTCTLHTQQVFAYTFIRRTSRREIGSVKGSNIQNEMRRCYGHAHVFFYPLTRATWQTARLSKMLPFTCAVVVVYAKYAQMRVNLCTHGTRNYIFACHKLLLFP